MVTDWLNAAKGVTVGRHTLASERTLPAPLNRVSEVQLSYVNSKAHILEPSSGGGGNLEVSGPKPENSCFKCNKNHIIWRGTIIRISSWYNYLLLIRIFG